MDQSETMVIDKQKWKDQMPKKEKKERTPNCSRCKGHGIMIMIKDHKQYCPTADCDCIKCVQTINRQKLMRLQTAHRRAVIQYESFVDMRKKGILSKNIRDFKHLEQMIVLSKGRVCKLSLKIAMMRENIKETGTADIPVIRMNGTNKRNSTPIKPVSPIEPVTNVAVPQKISPLLSQTASPVSTISETDSNAEQLEILIRRSEEILCQRYGYFWDQRVLAMMLVIVSGANADSEEAMKRLILADNAIEAYKYTHMNAFGVRYSHSGITGSLNTLGNPTYINEPPYVGMYPNSATNVNFIRYPLGAYDICNVKPEVKPSYPESPPEKLTSHFGQALKLTTSMRER